MLEWTWVVVDNGEGQTGAMGSQSQQRYEQDMRIYDQQGTWVETAIPGKLVIAHDNIWHNEIVYIHHSLLEVS